ncbi:hypothetical protein [Oceanobacillus bengalensis]|uniref:hypothetical protein n=1 Tax=Oceanobacillus bengalensis TaxID=1435466 RepID=UPI0036D3A64A
MNNVEAEQGSGMFHTFMKHAAFWVPVTCRNLGDIVENSMWFGLRVYGACDY